MAKNMFYSYNKIRSYNALFNFILSNRGGGKTFGGKEMVIKNFLKRGEMFVYVRRYKSEIKEVKDTFFDDIRCKFPNNKLESHGNKLLIDGKVAGYLIPLSVSQKFKSTAYPYVTTILFDEFIIDKGHLRYLNNEVEVFLDLFETIARQRENCKAYFLANNISIINPYFTYFNCVPKKNQRFTVAQNGEVVVEMFTDEQFIEAKKRTRFGTLINGTKYGDYAIENKSLRDNETFLINKKPKDSYFMFSIKFDGSEKGVYISAKEGIVYCSKNFMTSSKNRFSLQKDDHDINYIMYNKMINSMYFQEVLRYYRLGLMRFDSIETKTFFYDVFTLLGIK